MKRYDPAVAPDPAAWLALDESDRIELVEDYHRRARIRLPNVALHAAIQALVENQIAAGDEMPVRRTVARLMHEGLDRHDALHAVGLEAMMYMQELLRPAGGTPGSSDPDAAALARYTAAVEELTAAGWRAQAEDDTAAPLGIEDALQDLMMSRDALPDASMQWALDNWDQAAPRFLRMLQDFVSGADRSDGAMDGLFLIVHLLAEKRETAAFPLLCELLLDAEGSEAVLGDAITESLAGFLISTFDGDRLALRRVIEAPQADAFVRYAALEAMAYLTREGRIPEEETRSYLMHLRETMQPRAEDPVWDAWISVVANLGYADLEAEIESLLHAGFLDPTVTEIDWVRDRLRLVRRDADPFVGFTEDGVAPFDDAIGTLEAWEGYSGDEDDLDHEFGEGADADDLPAWPAADLPHVNPLRHVGRNDPCPCGSGRKYKKCCLQ